MKTIKVVVAVPTEGHSPAEAYDNRLLMMFHLGRFESDQRQGHAFVAEGRGADEIKKACPYFRAEWPVFEIYYHTAGRMFTPMARERLVDRALMMNADYIFMIDDDMLAPQDVLERLYRHNVDVCAALAFTRNPPHLPVLYTVREGWDPLLKQAYISNDWVRSYPKDKLVECDAVGFGGVLIKVSAIRKMAAPYFMSTCGTGEDILFCHKAKRAGARVFMDTSTKLGHLGSPIIVDEERAERFNDPEEMQKQFGAYKRHRVFEVAHFEDTGYDGRDEANKPAVHEVVLAGGDA